MIEIPQATLQRCAAGDVSALGQIYSVFGGRILRLCRNLLGHDADAEDAVQEVFLRVFERVDQFEGRSRFSTWLYRLAVNHCLNLRKARKIRVDGIEAQASLLNPEPPGSPFEFTVAKEESSQLREWIARLDGRSQALLLLREIEGLEYREIAEVLQVPMGTVMSGLSRARDRLHRTARVPPES